MFTNKDLLKKFFNIQKQIKPTHTIEIGSYDADFSQAMTRIINNKNIWAIEANVEAYNRFKDKLSNINYLNYAISDKDGITDFNVIRDSGFEWEPGASSILSRNDNLTTSNIQVQSITLDTFVKNNNISGKISLWIDAEGANREVLLGGTETLKNASSIFIEVEQILLWKDQWLKDDVIKHLSGFGFRLQHDESNSHPQQDLIFIK